MGVLKNIGEVKMSITSNINSIPGARTITVKGGYITLTALALACEEIEKDGSKPAFIVNPKIMMGQLVDLGCYYDFKSERNLLKWEQKPTHDYSSKPKLIKRTVRILESQDVPENVIIVSTKTNNVLGIDWTKSFKILVGRY